MLQSPGGEACAAGPGWAEAANCALCALAALPLPAQTTVLATLGPEHWDAIVGVLEPATADVLLCAWEQDATPGANERTKMRPALAYPLPPPSHFHPIQPQTPPNPPTPTGV